MSGANASPQGRSRQEMSGANASPEGRSLKQGRSRQDAKRKRDSAQPQEMTCRIAFLVLVCSVSVSLMSLAQEARVADQIRILPVRNNVYMLVSSAGNTTVQIGEDGVVVVDTLTSPLANSLLAAVRTLSSRPIRLIISTSFTQDHIGGNAVLAAAGRKMDGNAGASIRAHQGVLQRMSTAKGDNALPLDFWPTDAYNNQWDTSANGESILLLHEPAAHTDGDTIVYFRRSDVLSTGDVFSPDRFPKVDLEKAGSINGVVAALNHILKLTVPEVNQEGGTMVIPGHGHLCDEADVAEYRDMVTIVRDRVQDLVKKGMSLEQVKAARLTRDYDPVYGTPQYTGDMFVEAVYRSLMKSGASRSMEDHLRWKFDLLLVAAIFAAIPATAFAQRGQRGGPPGPPPTARQQAAFDLAGYWVSIVTEDWRWRMVTPAKGDYAGVPLNDEGRKTADGWDLVKDKANGVECRVFGAAAIMRMPARLRIAWQDDNTLKIETDAGQQARLFHFGSTPVETGERQWQGLSKATWFKQPQSTGLGFGFPAGGRGSFAGGNLKVMTTNMRAGYLRKNGVPYSENAVLTEYFNPHREPDGAEWFTVTTIVDDPKYLTMPFITTSSFRKEPDGSKWRPTACEIDPPREAQAR